MKLIINQKEIETECSNIASLALEQSIPLQGIAIAVNSQIIPRCEWDEQLLSPMDNIMIISATRGG